MFYEMLVTDHVRVDPNKFGMPTDEAVRTQLEESYSGFQDKELGTVVSVLEVLNVDEGIIIPGDGAAFVAQIMGGELRRNTLVLP